MVTQALNNTLFILMVKDIKFDLSGDTLSQTQLYIVHATPVTGSMGNKCVDE